MIKLGREESQLHFAEDVRNNVKASFQSFEAASHGTIYGFNTGYGGNATNHLDDPSSAGIQQRLARYLDCGTGDHLEFSLSRMALAARIHILARGFSAVSPEVLQETMVEIYNRGLALSFLSTAL